MAPETWNVPVAQQKHSNESQCYQARSAQDSQIAVLLVSSGKRRSGGGPFGERRAEKGGGPKSVGRGAPKPGEGERLPKPSLG